METYKIVGIDKKTGEYQNHPYENYYLHCENLKAASICGYPTKAFKISSKNIGELIGGYKLTDLLGKTFNPYYNEYQQLIEMRWCK